uniref:Uncharacterized protein n=1 Tax=Myoviridae sp. ctXwe21 TaxID=2825123 RepID=A0A8S5PZ89_9CAUD|nr:MAG TPA: hypothetical protein [Myoviridae sp. ctXwe21]
MGILKEVFPPPSGGKSTSLISHLQIFFHLIFLMYWIRL